MSKESAKALIDRLQSDPGFKESLRNASAEEGKKILEANGLSCTRDEFVEAYKSRLNRELNAQELAEIAAGGVPGQQVLYASFSI